MKDKKIPLSLVLGSGGARGLAHIGVIRAIHESSRYEICAVSGSSIGALIGGLYAAGNLDQYEQWVKELSAADVWKLLDFSFTNTGLFKGDRLMDKLNELVGDKDIADLNIAFTAVASDIGHRREVWLDSGPLFDASRMNVFQVMQKSLRNILRNKLHSILNLTGLIIGLVVFSFSYLYVKHEMSFDREWRDADQIYRLLIETGSLPGARDSQLDILPERYFHALTTNFANEIESASRVREITVRLANNPGQPLQ